MKNIYSALTLALLLTACANHNVEPEAVLTTDQDSVVVIGVMPANFEITIAPGDIKDGRFDFYSKPLGSNGPTLFGASENGFFVRSVPPGGNSFAIKEVLLKPANILVLPTPYPVCGEFRTMTFTIPPGKVLYLGSVVYKQIFATSIREAMANRGSGASHLDLTYTNDFKAAQAYINEKYPKLRNRLEPWPFQLMPSTQSCYTHV